MPVLLILILGTVMIIFWDFVKENVEIIGTFATSLAFLATAWAAYEARNSAKSAMKATQLTADSLIEMKKNSFKDFFELLLGQHNIILVDVNEALLKEDTPIIATLNSSTVQYISNLTGKPVFIKYINHIISILNFIDKEFYLSSSVNDKKKIYIDQLRNSISSDVNLIIAVFGLNTNGDKIYNVKELNRLLNEFNFFESELFFKDAISRIHNLKTYVDEIFDKEFSNKIEYYSNEMVRNHKFGIKTANVDITKTQQRIMFAVIWSYDNPCRKYLLEKFNDLPQQVRAKIGINMDESVEKVTDFESSLPNFVGWNLNIWKKRQKTIKNEKDIKMLIKIYPRYIKHNKIKGINLENGYHHYDEKEIKNSLSKYNLNIAYLMLKSDPRRNEIIGEIISETNKISDIYKSELDQFSFKKNI